MIFQFGNIQLEVVTQDRIQHVEEIHLLKVIFQIENESVLLCLLQYFLHFCTFNSNSVSKSLSGTFSLIANPSRNIGQRASSLATRRAAEINLATMAILFETRNLKVLPQISSFTAPLKQIVEII